MCQPLLCALLLFSQGSLLSLLKADKSLTLTLVDTVLLAVSEEQTYISVKQSQCFSATVGVVNRCSVLGCRYTGIQCHLLKGGGTVVGTQLQRMLTFQKPYVGWKKRFSDNLSILRSWHWSQLSYGVFCFYYRCAKPSSEYNNPKTFTSLNLLVQFSICELAQIWILISKCLYYLLPKQKKIVSASEFISGCHKYKYMKAKIFWHPKNVGSLALPLQTVVCWSVVLLLANKAYRIKVNTHGQIFVVLYVLPAPLKHMHAVAEKLHTLWQGPHQRL